MRTFDYKKRYERLLQPDIVALVAQIHEYKGGADVVCGGKSRYAYPVAGSCKNSEYGGVQ